MVSNANLIGLVSQLPLCRSGEVARRTAPDRISPGSSTKNAKGHQNQRLGADVDVPRERLMNVRGPSCTISRFTHILAHLSLVFSRAVFGGCRVPLSTTRTGGRGRAARGLPAGGEQGGPEPHAHGPGRVHGLGPHAGLARVARCWLGRSATALCGYLEPVSWNVPCRARSSNRLPGRFARRRLSGSLETCADVPGGREGANRKVTGQTLAPSAPGNRSAPPFPTARPRLRAPRVAVVRADFMLDTYSVLLTPPARCRRPGLARRHTRPGGRAR